MSVVSIILLILKIIGIIILFILGFLLLLILLVLFVPFRYKLISNKQADSNNVYIKFTFNWLLHFLNVKAEYDESKIIARARVLFIPIFRYPKKRKDKKVKETKVKKDRSSRKKALEERNAEARKLIEEASSDEFTLLSYEDIAENDETKENEVTKENELLNCDNIGESETASDNKDNDEVDNKENEPKVSFIKKILEYISLIIDFIKNAKSKLLKFKKKIINIINNGKYYLDLLTDEKIKDTLHYIWKTVSDLFRHIKPKKISLVASIGFDDPATTGQILVILSILYPVLYNKISITPVFDKSVIDYDLNVKGRICVISLLVAGFKLYFNKDIKLMIKRLKRKEAYNG